MLNAIDKILTLLFFSHASDIIPCTRAPPTVEIISQGCIVMVVHTISSENKNIVWISRVRLSERITQNGLRCMFIEKFIDNNSIYILLIEIVSWV